jgi:hypothetical protein
MNPLFDLLKNRLNDLWTELRQAPRTAEVLPLLRPVAPYAGPRLISPFTTLGVLLALVVSSGVAVAALGLLLLALLVLYFLFTEVLGISVEIKPL